MSVGSFRGIEIFLAVLDAGSFRAASSSIGVSKSVVSAEIALLEQRVGVRLLNRSTRTMSPTEAGKELALKTRPLVSGMQECISEIAGFSKDPKGKLRITTLPGLGLTQVTPWVSQYQQRYPNVEVEVKYDAIDKDIVSEGFDVAIRVLHLEESSMIQRKIAPNTMTFCASPSYIEDHGEPKNPKQLTRHRCLRNRDENHWPYWSSWNRALPSARRVEGLQPALTLDSMVALREATILGAGISLLPDYIVGPDIRRGRLKPLLTAWPYEHGSINCLFPERTLLPIKTRYFIDFVVEKTSPRPAWEWRD